MTDHLRANHIKKKYLQMEIDRVNIKRYQLLY